MSQFDRAIALEPNNYLALWDRGAQHYRVGNYVDAAADLGRAVELAPDESGPRSGLAQAYLNAGKLGEAQDAAESAVRLERSGRTLIALGMILLYESKELQAIPYLEEAAHNQSEPVYWLYLGVGYRRTQQHAKAHAANGHGRQLAEDALKRDVKNGFTRATLAYLAAALGDEKAALDEAIQAIRFSPADGNTQFLVALTFEALHRRTEAINLLQTVSRGVLDDLSRWPDVADLVRDSRFLQLTAPQDR